MTNWRVRRERQNWHVLPVAWHTILVPSTMLALISGKNRWPLLESISSLLLFNACNLAANIGRVQAAVCASRLNTPWIWVTSPISLGINNNIASRNWKRLFDNVSRSSLTIFEYFMTLGGSSISWWSQASSFLLPDRPNTPGYTALN